MAPEPIQVPPNITRWRFRRPNLAAFPKWVVWAGGLVGLVGSIGLGYEYVDSKYARLQFVSFKIGGVQSQIDKLHLANLYARLDRLQGDKFRLQRMKRSPLRDERLQQVNEQIRRIQEEIRSIQRAK